MTMPSLLDTVFIPRRGRPKTPDVERRLLNAARSFIARRGLDDVSMHEIASKARTTKTTLYVYFRSKQGLLEAVVHDLLAQLPDANELVPSDLNDPIEEQLLVLAGRVDQLLSSANFELARRALASDIPAPLSEHIWKTAALPYLRAIEEYLLAQAQGGRLDLKDSRSAVSWFLTLIAGGQALRSQWRGASCDVLENDHLRKAVQLFIKGHAPQPGTLVFLCGDDISVAHNPGAGAGDAKSNP